MIPLGLDEKQKELDGLMANVEELERTVAEKRRAKQRDRARRDLCFWMDNAIIPFLSGLSSSYREPLLEGVKRLIREGKNPFRPMMEWDRTKEVNHVILGFLSRPQTKVLGIMAKPIIRMKTSFLKEEIPWIREGILKEGYPDLYEAVMETEGGQDWLDGILLDLVNALRTYLR